MSNKYNIAVVGATGNVGREIVQILEQRDFPVDRIFCLASSRSKGKIIDYIDQKIIVEDLAPTVDRIELSSLIKTFL